MDNTISFEIDETTVNEDGSLTIIMTWSSDEDLAPDAGEE